jgi:hypothetical protein
VSSEPVVFEATGRVFLRDGPRLDEVEMRQKRMQRAAPYMFAAPLLLPPIAAWLSGDMSSLRIYVFTMMGCVPFIVLCVLYLRTMRVIVTPSTLNFRRIAITKKVALSTVASVVVLQVQEDFGRGMRVSDRIALLVDVHGRSKLTLWQKHWGSRNFRSVLVATAKPIHDFDDQLRTSVDIMGRYPGSFSWLRAHIRITAVLSVFPLIVVLVLVVSLLDVAGAP